MEHKHFISVAEQVDIVRNGEFCGVEEVSVWEHSKMGERPDSSSFYEYLKSRYPRLPWEYDDGEDWNNNPSTDFVQCVAYLNADKTRCVLACYEYECEY